MPTNAEINPNLLPVLPLRGLVLFPGTALTIDISRKASLGALRYASLHDRLVFVVAQNDLFTEEPGEKDLYEIGCIAKLRQTVKIGEDTVKVVLEGVCRAGHGALTQNDYCVLTEVTEIHDKPVRNRPVYMETLLRRMKMSFAKFISCIPGVPTEVVMRVESGDDLSFLTDFIAFSVPAPYDDKQYILEQNNVVTRTKILIDMLEKESEIAKIDQKINAKTKEIIDQNQREYYLREQMKVISCELYGDECDEIEEYHSRIEALKAPESVKEKLHGEVVKLDKMPQGSHDGSTLRGYLDTCLELPWEHTTKLRTDIKRAERILDRDIYGMEKVKERILELLSVYTLAPDIKGQIICLVGPPGVGKTSIGKTIAECMGRNFARISLGGVHDEAEIRGHRRTYIGAMPGKIIKAIQNAGSGNPLLLLDEIDKLAGDYHGDPAAALLEVLDPEQNVAFSDHYIEIPYDLSRTVFIATANNASTIPKPLLDRMEVIELPGYTREEKLQIAKRHLAPRQLSQHGLSPKMLRFTDGAFYTLIDFYTREAGVRRLERCIAALCRKAAKRIAEGETKKITLKAEDVEAMLGKKRYRPEALLEHDEVGIINGLAWTSVGGEIMQLEVNAMVGTGKVELTGSLGSVMQESAKAAVSFVRANAEVLGIDPEFYKNRDIHIHATEAAVPKDGPSAGVTMTVGLVSALSGLPVRRDVAMTGEVTIRGRVLPIGGLREKSMAAYTGGVKTVFIPKANLPDLEEVDAVVKEHVEFVPVSHVEEILSRALVRPKETSDTPAFLYREVAPQAAVTSVRQ